MAWKRVLGTILVIVSAALLVGAILSIYFNMAHTGPMAGKLNTYTEPFKYHIVLVFAMFIASVISFLFGVVLIRLGQKYK